MGGGSDRIWQNAVVSLIPVWVSVLEPVGGEVVGSEEVLRGKVVVVVVEVPVGKELVLPEAECLLVTSLCLIIWIAHNEIRNVIACITFVSVLRCNRISTLSMDFIPQNTLVTVKNDLSVDHLPRKSIYIIVNSDIPLPTVVISHKRIVIIELVGFNPIFPIRLKSRYVSQFSH